MVFPQKIFEKAYFIVKMTGLAIKGPAGQVVTKVVNCLAKFYVSS